MKRKHLIVIGILVVAGLALGVGTVATQRMGDDDIEVSIDAVPAAVKATILAQAGGNPVKEVEMETENGATVYEAEVVIDGKETDIRVDSEGNLLGAEVEDDEDEEGDDDEEDEEGDDDEDEDEGDDETEVSLSDLPAAVLATLQREAPDAQIEEVELETEDGRTQYAIDAVIDGQTFDIEIAPDGTLLQKELEDEDDD